MQSARLFKSTLAYSFATVFIGFFMTALSYLSWFYRLVDLVPVHLVDVLSMGVAYTLQAVGVGVFALLLARKPAYVQPRMVVLVLAVYAALAFPAVMGPALPLVLAGGYAMALLCGFIAGFYLYQLARLVPERYRALVFGGGYCAASVAQWLLSAVGAGVLLRTPDALAVHVVLALVFAYLLLWETPTQERTWEDNRPSAAGAQVSSQPVLQVFDSLPENLLPLACMTVAFVSIVKSLGYGFPTTDIIGGVDLELSRLFYAAGLVIAGIIADKNRQWGAICCLAACISPFITLALADGSLSATLLWGLDYFFQGFFIVFRVILFADIAARTGKFYLAGFGLMVGRLGDAIGTSINALLGMQSISLIALTAILFVLTVFLFFRLMQVLYTPKASGEQSEERRFESFCAAYSLSARERQVLRCILDERSNSEIAADMFVTEATVKFHVHNLLGKTNCKRRTDLMAAFATFDSSC